METFYPVNANIFSGLLAKLIVGVDPGERVGIAAIDIRTGEIILDTEFPNDILMKIAGLGDPVIIATDTQRSSKKVMHIASAFGARLWRPRRNIPVKEKIRLARTIKTKNSHERDALAAALCAKNHYSNLFRKIEKKMRMHGMAELSESVKETVIKERISIARAVNMV